MKTYYRLILLTLTLLLITGCSSNATKAELEATKPVPIYEVLQERSKEIMYVEHELPLTSEGTVDKETFIYENIQRNMLLRRDDLTGIMTPDMNAKVDIFVSSLPSILNGSSLAETIPDGLANYILFEMERTPYQYEVKSYDILGVDARTQRVFVDVKFTTNGNQKEIKAASRIVRGEPEYETKLKLRFARYDRMVRQKLSESYPSSFFSNLTTASYSELKQEFEHYYGPVSIILEEQRNLSIIGYVRSGATNAVAGGLVYDGQAAALSGAIPNAGGKATSITRVKSEDKHSFEPKGNFSELLNASSSNTDTVYVGSGGSAVSPYTYSGITSSIMSIKPTDETLTFRFVLKSTTPDIVTGSYRAMSGYLVNRNNGDSRHVIYDDIEVINNYTRPISWFIERINAVIEVDDHQGMYVLTADYANLDKFYADYFHYTYRSIITSNPVIIGKEGSLIEVLDTRRIQTRGRDIDITMPTYLEKVLYVIDVAGEDYQLVGSKIISSTLTTEPTTLVRGTTDVSVQSTPYRSVTASETADINLLLNSFSRMQTNKEIDSAGFDALLDPALSSTKKIALKGEATTVTADKKYTFVDLTRATSEIYIDVVVTEVYITEEGTIFASNVVFGFINRNGVWYVASYKRDLLTGLQNMDMYDVNLALETIATAFKEDTSSETIN